MSISVIIPCYKEHNNLKRLIPYLINHGENRLKDIIIVDAHNSGDQVKELCESMDVTYIRSPVTQRAYQLNMGASYAQGNILFFLHADTLPPKTYIDNLTDLLSGENRFGYFRYSFDKNTLFLRINGYFTRYKGIFSGGGDQGHFMEKNLYKELNGYDEEYELMEDFAFMDKIRKHKIPYDICPATAMVSSRKYNNHSYLKVNLTNLYLVILFKLGVKPSTLKDKYRTMMRV